MKELTELGKEDFQKSALEGPVFKSIIRSIESAALEGYTGWHKTLSSHDDIRELKVIQKALIDAGYESEFKYKSYKNLLGMNSTTTTFHVNWN